MKYYNLRIDDLLEGESVETRFNIRNVKFCSYGGDKLSRMDEIFSKFNINPLIEEGRKRIMILNEDDINCYHSFTREYIELVEDDKEKILIRYDIECHVYRNFSGRLIHYLTLTVKELNQFKNGAVPCITFYSDHPIIEEEWEESGYQNLIYRMEEFPCNISDSGVIAEKFMEIGFSNFPEGIGLEEIKIVLQHNPPKIEKKILVQDCLIQS